MSSSANHRPALDAGTASVYNSDVRGPAPVRPGVARTMRTQLQIGGYELEFDRDATAACYARVRVPGPEACGCADCRSWVAARQHVLPPEMRELLAQLGIPADGEIEVAEMPGPSQPHLYGGWYFVVGRILSGGGDRTFHMES